MSQGLARLRFSNEIVYTDVEEAIRIMHESKLTAKKKAGEGFKMRDYQTAIWEIIRQAAQAHNTKTLKKRPVLEQIRRRGYSEEQFETTLQDYEQLNVLQRSRHSITLV